MAITSQRLNIVKQFFLKKKSLLLRVEIKSILCVKGKEITSKTPAMIVIKRSHLWIQRHWSTHTVPSSSSAYRKLPELPHQSAQTVHRSQFQQSA